MNNLQILPGTTLSVKIGIGYGKCGILYVGGVYNRSETLTVGEALTQALKSEGMSGGGGDVVIAEPCFKHVAEYFRATELINEETHEKFFKVNLRSSISKSVKIQADSMKMRQ